MKRFGFLFACLLLLCTTLSAQTYRFETINYPGDTFTQLLGINNSFLIAGYHNFAQNSGFTLQLSGISGGEFVNENYPGSMQTQVIGVNNGGITDGFYIDQQGNNHGFYKRGRVYQTVDFPGTPFNQLLSQNDQNQAAGYYSLSQNNSTPDTPYVYDEKGGVFQVIVIPGATGGAQATGVNNSQQICGFYIDANGVNHGFLLNFGVFTRLDYPGSIFTQALGLNNSGNVVGVYMDASLHSHGFVYTRAGGFFTSVDDPNGVGTTVVNGINDLGLLVGFYGTAPTNSGFVAYPQQ
jgi:hypothetical protein